MGFGLNALSSLVSYFPRNCIVSLSLGIGIAGILINLVRYITLFSFFGLHSRIVDIKKKQFYETLIFFSFSFLICFICFICTFILFDDEYFIYKLRNSGEFFENYSIINKDKEEIIENIESEEVFHFYFI